MKKRILAAVLCGLLIAGLAGCKMTTEKEKELQPDSTVSADVTSDKKISDDIPAVPTVSAELQNPADSSSEAQLPEKVTEDQTKPPAPEQTPETRSPVLTEKPTQPAQSTLQTTEPPKQETQPTESQNQKPTEPPKPTEPETSPQETEKPTEPPASEFDISYWISYAKSYAEDIGLKLDSEAVWCWDTPITAGAECIYLERDIQSRLSRYHRDADITAVWIWAEPRADGDYDLYIGYA